VGGQNLAVRPRKDGHARNSGGEKGTRGKKNFDSNMGENTQGKKILQRNLEGGGLKHPRVKKNKGKGSAASGKRRNSSAILLQGLGKKVTQKRTGVDLVVEPAQ